MIEEDSILPDGDIGRGRLIGRLTGGFELKPPISLAIPEAKEPSAIGAK